MPHLTTLHLLPLAEPSRSAPQLRLTSAAGHVDRSAITAWADAAVRSAAPSSLSYARRLGIALRCAWVAAYEAAVRAGEIAPAIVERRRPQVHRGLTSRPRPAAHRRARRRPDRGRPVSRRPYLLTVDGIGRGKPTAVRAKVVRARGWWTCRCPGLDVELDAAAGLVVTLAAEINRARPATLDGLRALTAWVERQAEGSAHDDLLALFAGTVAVFGEVST